MPIDTPKLTALEVLKRIANFYAEGEHRWTKRMNLGSRELAKGGIMPIPVHTVGEADCACLRGALIICSDSPGDVSVRNMKAHDGAMKRLAQAVREVDPYVPPRSHPTTVIIWNDARKTTYKDILRVTKRALELEAVG